MRILVLDTKNRVVDNISRYKGTVNSSVLRAAEVYRPAVIRNCPAVIICHNHPSGDPLTSIGFLGKKGEKEGASSRDLLR